MQGVNTFGYGLEDMTGLDSGFIVD
jgi:hypothetical protein